MVVSEVRRYMEAAVERLSPARAQEMARSLVRGQSQRKEQVQRVAQDLMDWSNQMRERMTEMIRREVARQLKTMGVATKDEVEALKVRVRKLERTSGAKAPARKTATAKAPATTPSRAGGATSSATRSGTGSARTSGTAPDRPSS